MSIDACAELVRSGDPDRFMTVMVSPREVRARLLVLYAFNLEIARAPWVTQEEMIAEMRLQWWADAVDEIYEGKPVRKHEVVVPLGHLINEHKLPRDLFDAMISARRFDIYKEPHKHRADFDTYIRATSGSLMRLAALSLGANDVGLDIVRSFSYGTGVASLLRALPILYENGRSPIPVEGALDRNEIFEGRVPDNLATILKEITEDAASDIQAVRVQRHLVPKTLNPALLPGWQAMVPVWRVHTNQKTAFQAHDTSEIRKKSSLYWRALSGRW